MADLCPDSEHAPEVPTLPIPIPITRWEIFQNVH